MSISDNGDEFEVECDACGSTQVHDKDITASYGEDNGFLDMIESLKGDDWRVYKSNEDGEWYHLCSDCK